MCRTGVHVLSDDVTIGEVMQRLQRFFLGLSQDEKAQDMVEYALLAGFIAVAAGALLPPIANGISIIFSKMTSVTSNAPLQ